MQRLVFDQDFTLPIERVYDYLAEHEHLQVLFAPIKVERLNDGTDSRNGVGSARKLSLAGQLPFVETVTEAIPNERIAYKITKGSPLKNHSGVMQFTSLPSGGSHLHYVIEFGSKIPGVDIVIGKAIARSVSAGLKKVDAKA